jgi:hypothetical protein
MLLAEKQQTQMAVQDYGQVFLWGIFKISAIIAQTLSETLNSGSAMS